MAESFSVRRQKMELIYIAGIFLFFAVLVAMAYGCAKLGGTK